jgi:hypothetical protein
MRDQTKVVIGFGSIWGLFALGATLISSFTIGSNDTKPEIVALVIYGLTILPCCILAIWFRRPAALWLISLAAISGFGFVYQLVVQGLHRPFVTLLGDAAWMLFLAAIPGLLGFLLLRDSPSRNITT